MSHLNDFLRYLKQFAAKYILNEKKPSNSIELSTAWIHRDLLRNQVVLNESWRKLLTVSTKAFSNSETGEMIKFLALRN